MFQFIYGKYDGSGNDYSILECNGEELRLSDKRLAEIIIRTIKYTDNSDAISYKLLNHCFIEYEQKKYYCISSFICGYNKDYQNRYTNYYHVQVFEKDESKKDNLFKSLINFSEPETFNLNSKILPKPNNFGVSEPEPKQLIQVLESLSNIWKSGKNCFLLVDNSQENYTIEQVKTMSLLDLSETNPLLSTILYILSKFPPIISRKIIAQFGYDNVFESNIPQYANIIVGFKNLISTNPIKVQFPPLPNLIELNLNILPDSESVEVREFWDFLMKDFLKDDVLLKQIEDENDETKTLPFIFKTIFKRIEDKKKAERERETDRERENKIGILIKSILEYKIHENQEDFKILLQDKKLDTNRLEISILNLFFCEKYDFGRYDAMIAYTTALQDKIENKFRNHISTLSVSELENIVRTYPSQISLIELIYIQIENNNENGEKSEEEGGVEQELDTIPIDQGTLERARFNDNLLLIGQSYKGDFNQKISAIINDLRETQLPKEDKIESIKRSINAGILEKQCAVRIAMGLAISPDKLEEVQQTSTDDIPPIVKIKTWRQKLLGLPTPPKSDESSEPPIPDDTGKKTFNNKLIWLMITFLFCLSIVSLIFNLILSKQLKELNNTIIKSDSLSNQLKRKSTSDSILFSRFDNLGKSEKFFTKDSLEKVMSPNRVLIQVKVDSITKKPHDEIVFKSLNLDIVVVPQTKEENGKKLFLFSNSVRINPK